MRGLRTVVLCCLCTGVAVCRASEPPADLDNPADRDRPVGFDNTVLPILTQAGCNTGACHGAAIGRGGFRLSLYGQDAEADFNRITRSLGGRRVNLADPEESLLLRKAGEFIEHGGGMPLPPDGDGWQAVLRWVTEGCRRGLQPPLESIRVEPSQLVLRGATAAAEVRVVGRFGDGTEADLTRWSLLTAQDQGAIEIGERAGTFAVRRPGRHTIIARLRDRVAAIEVIAASPAGDEPSSASGAPSASRLDRLIDRKLDLLGLTPSGSLGDAGFLRRLTLDLTGRLPTPDQLRDFVASRRVDKRRRWIDRLLASDAAVDYWTYWLARSLRMRTPGQGNGRDVGATARYHGWLREQIAACRPLPQLVTELLTAEGAADRNGAVGFYLSANDARSQAELFSEVMLGSRLRCANCHDHPLDRWTQEDYHGLAAIFAGVQRGPVVAWRDGQSVIHPGTGEPAVPQLPGGDPIEQTGDLRGRLAEWLTDRSNPLLARAWVNRVWASLLGRGLIDPVDDIRATNPPTHPALLDALVVDWRDHGFDLRYLVRRIASTAAYARAVEGSQAERSLAETWYARGAVRPLSAEVLVDAIGDVTDLWEAFPQRPAGSRAVALSDPGIESAALDVLGRCEPGAECQTTGNVSPALSQKLTLLCGPLINRRVADPEGRVARWAAADPGERAGVIDAMYRRCLSRGPRAAETQYWLGELRSAADPQHVIEDLAWSLLTCREFTTNH